MNRKHTISRIAAVVFAAATIVSVAGCGAASASGNGVASAKAVDKLGKAEGRVSILAWPGYVEDGSNDPNVDWVSKFEQDTGCQVTSKTYGTSDEAYNLIKTSDKYDVVAASGDLTLRLINGGLVQPLNTGLIPSYKSVYSFLKNRDFNTVDGKTYGVPHGYGANMLMYSKSTFSEAPTSWDVMFDTAKASQYKGKIDAYDSPIYIADAAIYLMKHKPELGIKNPYALDKDQLKAATDLLKEQNVNVGEYWSDYLKLIQSFQSGDAEVGVGWQVAYNQLDSSKYGIAMPQEGVTGWSDSWMISSKTKNTTCAYKWLDYIDSPEANAQATEYFGEAPANSEACKFATDKDFCTKYHAGDEAYEKQIWYWTTPISDCLDGRKNVKCTDYTEWTKAWQEIKG
ncbi:extracellular solute-binding protein [Bifidobacterium callimiconis]|uniref:extracellular solute-binding protein n=1 Tax=Bifidobacterium callimiconis TaxID=2306973 RepID=UPI001BDD3AFA|nr:extracellular solute-binding protein [Bifidobacterium callimiconis]MBT1178014.1 extracellular solute-binding protein [Bifidobacterium callimiconis]